MPCSSKMSPTVVIKDIYTMLLLFSIFFSVVIATHLISENVHSVSPQQ